MLISYHSESWKSEIRVSAWLGKGLFPGFKLVESLDGERDWMALENSVGSYKSINLVYAGSILMT